MEKNEITVIASDLLAAEKAKKVMDDQGKNYRIVLSSGPELPRIAKNQEKNGAKVLIAFGMFAKIVRQNVDIPVIMVDIIPDDVTDALLEAAKYSKKIAIIGFQNVLGNVKKLRNLLNIDLQMIPTVLPDEIEQVISEIEPDRVLIGGYYQSRIACKYNIRCVVLCPRDSEIEKALSVSETVIQEQNMAKEDNEKSALENSIYAVITVDMEDNILLMNRLAAQYLGLAQLKAVAFNVQDVCPEFTRIHDAISKQEAYINQIARIGEKTFLYHAEPLLQNKKVTGATVTFQDTEIVLREERNIRRTLTVKTNKAQYSLDQILGRSASMTQTMKLALRYASVDETLLLLGETGVGKELFAQGIHQSSRRKSEPFVAINCASLPENILESELFGYVRGAFTGADREGKRGLFEQAHKGTIFLDEIGEISMSMQGKLLRVLQEHSIRRVGGDKPIPVDIRVIAATNRNLVESVRKGTFRSDLYFRLNVLCLRIPPLRERYGDALLLAGRFLSEASARDGRHYSFSKEAEEEICNYSWPGNVRELQNLIRRMVVISDDVVISADLIRDYIVENQGLIEEKEEKMMTLEQALRESGNNRTKAAELLGVSRATLYRMIERRE